jgi:hypothetical protein
MRKVMVWIGTAALLVALVGGVAGTSSAANLTGGQYTYVLNGEEVTFPFDPVKLTNGLLIPVDVFQRFHVEVEHPLEHNVTLRRADVTATVTMGTPTFTLNGEPATLESAPLRLNGRLFLPAGLLKHLGVEYSSEGTFVVLRDSGDGMPYVREVTQVDYDRMRGMSSFTASVKADSGIMLDGDFTLLNEDLLIASANGLDYGTRARLFTLLKTNTVVLVTLSNNAGKAGGVVENGFFVVDDQRNQYELESVVATSAGLITAKIAPSANRTGVLVFPRVSPKATALSLYYDPNGSDLGVFSRLQ